MTMQLDLAPFPGPAYRALADGLAAAIDEGRLTAGAKLPPQRDLAFSLRVTTGTVGRAYDLLARRGLVRGEVGRGTFVLARPQRDGAAGAAPRRLDLGSHFDLTANYPAPMPAQARLAELWPTGRDAPELMDGLLRYPPTAGSPRHREAAADWLGRLGVATTPDQVVLTNGAEGGLAAALLALGRPGNPILAEALCYSGLRSLAARLGQHLEPVAMDAHGPVPEALAAAARDTGSRVLVITPNLQNPTALTMPSERRAAIAEVARTADLRVIEDDVYGPLLPERPPPLASLMPERTVYLSSLSKFLAPGLRLGFLCGPDQLVREVTAAQCELSLGQMPAAAEVLARAGRAGLLDLALTEQRRELAARQGLAAEILAGFGPVPPVALHVWLRLPGRWTSAEAALALARAGVLVAPAERFAIHRGGAPNAVRLSVSAPSTHAQLRQALSIVARTLLAAGDDREAANLV